MKQDVMRTCMGCNEKKDKKELLRIAINKNKEISVDKTGKLSGRGAYICHNEDCLNKVIKTKKMERVLKTKINDEIYNNIRELICRGEFIG